jgi:hypothetical protein
MGFLIVLEASAARLAKSAKLARLQLQNLPHFPQNRRQSPIFAISLLPISSLISLVGLHKGKR